MAAFLNNPDDHAPMSEINITPFVDVMLVLLVIFMVTAPLLENGIPIELPRASAKAIPKTEEPVTLSLSRDGRIFLDRREVYFSTLKDNLTQFFEARQEKQVYIRADGSLPYAVVAQTMAVVKQAGINRIGLVTLPPETGETSTKNKK